MRKIMCVHVWYEHEGILDKSFCQGLLLCLWRIPSKNFMHSPDHILLKIMFMRYINLWKKPLRSLSAYANYCMIGMHLLRILFIWISIYKLRFRNSNTSSMNFKSCIFYKCMQLLSSKRQTGNFSVFDTLICKIGRFRDTSFIVSHFLFWHFMTAWR